MVYDNKLFARSSDAFTLNDHVHTPDEVFRVSSGNERSYRPGRLSAVPKIEADDNAWSTNCKPDRSIHSHKAQAAIKQQVRKQRRNRRKADEENEEVDFWPGLRAAELESPRYLQYREKVRQRARDRPGENNVWTDILENAFQLAIRVVPPVGRKKKTENLKDGPKLCGRNELISQKIEKWTGIHRSRKQISSHIQVLRPFMFNNEEWLQHVNAPKAITEGRVAPQTHLHNIDLHNLDDEDFRMLVRDPYGQVGPKLPSSALMRPPPNVILGSNAPDHRPVLNRIEFQMYVESPTGEKIHDYTCHQAEIGAAPRALEEICNWRMSFPLLQDYYEKNQLDSDIILIESNIDLLAEYPPKQSRLSTRFIVNIAGAAGNERWSTKADYYENNGQPLDMEKFYEINNIHKASPWDTPEVLQAPGSRDVQLLIPLQSNWWVQLFTRMAARRHGMRHDPCLLQQEVDWSRRYLQEMSIMQELRMNHGIAGTSSKRVAIILWRFYPTRCNEAATTSWRKLKPPPQRFKINSPVQSPEPPLQHSMVLDSSLHTIAMPQPVFACAERFLHQSDLFAKDSERIVSESQSAQDSPSSALSPDYTSSFPSSTTTSFPPSVTQGYLSHEESQEQESFASQNSFNFSQKSTYVFQDNRTHDEDLTHLSRNSQLESQDLAYYSQQSLDALPKFHSPDQYDDELCQDGLNHQDSRAAHDFSGGQIQVAFQTHDAPSNPSPLYFEPPPNLSQFEHAAQTDSQIIAHELHSGPHDFSALQHDQETMATGLSHNDELDFSSWEVNFTPEQLAALRTHNGDFNVQNSEVHFNLHETYQFEGHQGYVQTDSDWTLVETKNHFHNPAIEQPDHGAIVGEVADEELVVEESQEADDVGDSFGFEEIYAPESQLAESQVVGSQAQDIDRALEQSYEDHDLHEDHL
ncbi:MAG: hypothetical protein Q9166_003083 [cf. Caloplaca sp. 2 TL-2023]